MDLRRSVIGRCLVVALAAGAFAAPAAQSQTRFSAEAIEQGREQYMRSCRGCHGVNMVNGGTSAYDLRRFPVDDSERFFNSVSNGKSNMPAFKDSLSPEQLKLVWAYVGSRGGKEP